MSEQLAGFENLAIAESPWPPAGTTRQVPYPAAFTDPSAISASDPQISGNGRYIAYAERKHLSAFTVRYLIYVYDRQVGTLERVDVRSDGTPSNECCPAVHAISDDGRYVMFRSADLVAGDSGNVHEYVRDRVARTTYLVDRNAKEERANDGWSYASNIAGDGTRVAMSLQATNMVPNDTNGVVDAFVRAFPGAP